MHNTCQQVLPEIELQEDEVVVLVVVSAVSRKSCERQRTNGKGG